VIIWWALTAAAADPCSDPAAVAERSAIIQKTYEEGEAEKADRTASAASVLERDEARVARMVKYDKAGELCTPTDKWNAAWIMTQADKPATLERAYAIAQEAMNAGVPNGNWLVAYTFDAKRVAGGYRQSYGTQTQTNERGQRCLVDIEPDVTDETRISYDQPPLADVYRRVLDSNGFTADAPTVDRMERRGLFCKPQARSKKAGRQVAAPAP
jgi:hypothetical protein